MKTNKSKKYYTIDSKKSWAKGHIGNQKYWDFERIKTLIDYLCFYRCQIKGNAYYTIQFINECMEEANALLIKYFKN